MISILTLKQLIQCIFEELQTRLKLPFYRINPTDFTIAAVCCVRYTSKAFLFFFQRPITIFQTYLKLSDTVQRLNRCYQENGSYLE
jgi:hypothetical protein